MNGIRVAFSKWGGARHWEYDILRLGEDRHGTWLGVPHGTTYERPGARFVAAWAHVALVPPAAGFLASFHEDDPGAPVHTYVDITTPASWEAGVVRAVDLDLDVVRERTDRVFVDDEDEFGEHRVQLGYPAELVEHAVRTCAEVREAVEARLPPFDGPTAEHWLAALRP